MAQIIALAFSDLHLNLWSKFNKDNQRTFNGFRVMEIIAKRCEQLKVPALFCGDLFHKPETLDQELALITQIKFNRLSTIKWKMIAIEGNHDLQKVNSIDKPTHSWISIFSPYYKWLDNLDFNSTSIGDKYIIHGVPYIDHNIGLSKYLKELPLQKGYKHILLLHTDYPGAKDTDGRVVDSVENINLNALNRFDLILCGHIHKYQRLSKKVYMVGAPYQQRRTDKNCKMGYLEIYSDLSVKFVPLDFPKFIDVESEDEIKDDGNYYTIIPKENHSKVEVIDHKITKQLSKEKLAKRYMKAKGIKDEKKQKLLVKILKEAEQ